MPIRDMAEYESETVLEITTYWQTWLGFEEPLFLIEGEGGIVSGLEVTIDIDM